MQWMATKNKKSQAMGPGCGVLTPRKSDGAVSFPRGGYRTYLANCGLIWKLHMTSDMDKEDVAREIRSIFKGPMKGKASNFNIYKPLVVAQIFNCAWSK